VSAELVANTGGYFAALTRYRDGDAAPIVERFSEATVLAIANGRQLVADLRNIRKTWDDVITARSDSAVWKVADLVIRRAVVTLRYWRRSWGSPPPTLTATSTRSRRRESLSRRRMGLATECGVLLKCSLR
jgi:hypothetical protein